MKTYIASAVTILYIVIGTFIFGVLAIFFSFLKSKRLAYLMARMWAKGFLKAAGVKVAKIQEEPLLKDGLYIYMANHKSLFDIPALLATLPSNALFLAKHTLFNIPIFGRALYSLGFVPVDRSNKYKKVKSFKLALLKLNEKKSLVIFPEETRSEGRLLPFKEGGFRLAKKAGVPIVPVSIIGSDKIVQKGSFFIKPGEILVIYSKPVYPDKEVNYIKKIVRERISSYLGEVN